MATFVKGDIVVVPFPFSDLTASKRRPALVIQSLIGDDLVLCQITSQLKSDQYSISLNDADLIDGQLNKKSYLRPNRLFTADKAILLYKIAKLSPEKVSEVIEKIYSIMKA